MTKEENVYYRLIDMSNELVGFEEKCAYEEMPCSVLDLLDRAIDALKTAKQIMLDCMTDNND